MGFLISAIEFTALFVALVVVPNLQIDAESSLSVPILAVAFVALVFGWRSPRIHDGNAHGIVQGDREGEIDDLLPWNYAVTV